MKGKVTCSSCGWSWNKSDSSKKDLYICHECGRDNSNNMKNGGWLDNYGEEENYNDYEVSAPEGFEGDGYSNVGRNYSPAWGGQFREGGKVSTTQEGTTKKPLNIKSKAMTSKDSVAHQADKILKYEQLRGGPGGAPLPYYSDPQYMDMLMGNVYPEVQKIMPNASAMEAGEAMDFVFNAGWDKDNNKITKDPRAFALQEYYRQNDPSKLDKDGKWSGRKNAPYSFDQEYANTIGKLPENQRRLLMNKGRDWYYKNINNPSPGVPSSNYNDTWYGRIWNTNDFLPFDPNNPKFTPKKQIGGSVYPVNYVPQAQDGKLTFLQPTSNKLPEGYRIPYSDPSSERAMSIGGEDGEPAYLIPSFKYGQPLDDPMEEFRKTGEHLGGPFETYQEADEWERTVRHPAVERKENIMFPQEQFAMGGSIPGAVGFTYARTKGIPSNGPYAKKTLASAQDGVDMYDNSMLARRVDNPNINRSYYDPRLNTMNIGTDYTTWKDDEGNQLTGDDLKYHQDKLLAHENYHAIQHSEDRDNYDIAHNTEDRQWAEMQKRPQMMTTDDVWNNFYNRSDLENQQDFTELINNVPETRILNKYLLFDKVLDRQRYDNPSNAEGEAKFYEDTGVQLGKQSPFSLNFTEFQNGGWLDSFAEGGIIKDDRGQWAHPGEITEIGSNNITMRGVPYDVLGISDTGDTKLMKPGKNYKFKGKKVTEFPMAKNGVNQQDEKTFEQLDQLTNFTNYNKPQPGGWLNKYN